MVSLPVFFCFFFVAIEKVIHVLLPRYVVKPSESHSQEEVIDTIVKNEFSGIGHSFPNVYLSIFGPRLLHCSQHIVSN